MRIPSPVRVGNSAFEQLQLDIFGEIADAMFQALKGGMAPSERGLALQPVIMDYLATAWRRRMKVFGRRVVADSTSSIQRSWRGSHSIAQRTRLRIKVISSQRSRWRAIADEIHAEVCERSFDRELNSFVQAYGSKRLDASLLHIPLVGFLPPTDPRSTARSRRLRTNC